MHKLSLIVGLAVSLTIGSPIIPIPSAFGQDAPQIYRVVPTKEGSIMFYISSSTNETYNIDYADQLNGNEDGTTAWMPLYRDIPSQGSNTLIADNGNFNVVPNVAHPKTRPMRFYRISTSGQETGEVPVVNITSLTEGQSLSDWVTISVEASSSYGYVSTKLFVDGQEMNPSEDGTNYLLHTPEWKNGTHIIFATATAMSAIPGPSGNYPVDVGYGASSRVTVNFDNFINNIAFSEPFFEPSKGQIQHVTADLVTNSDWTLQIVDEDDTPVRTVMGSGKNISFYWDGTGDGGVDIPDGVYHYNFSAQPNGLLSVEPPAGGGGGLPTLPPMPETFMAEFGAAYLAQQQEMQVNFLMQQAAENVRASKSSTDVSVTGASTVTLRSGGGGGTDGAPDKPPTSPVKGARGTVGIAYFDCLAEPTLQVPNNGMPMVPAKISFGGTGTANVKLPGLKSATEAGNSFAMAMKKGGYSLQFMNWGGMGLRLNDLRKTSLGGQSIFSSVNIGLFMTHGNYGTSSSIEYHSDANGSVQSYFASDNPADANAQNNQGWLRLSEFGLNGDMRWMCISACYSLYNAQNAINHGCYPQTPNCHLICGATTVTHAAPEITKNWARNMTGRKGIPIVGWGAIAPQKIVDAWFNAGKDYYRPFIGKNVPGIPSVVTFRVTGWDNCWGDTLKSYPASGSGSVTIQDSQVYP